MSAQRDAVLAPYKTRLDGQRAVVPTVKGTANIVGYAKWLIEPADPVGAGFIVS